MTDPKPEPPVFDEDTTLPPQLEPATEFPTDPPAGS